MAAITQDQALIAVRWIVSTAGGYAVGRGWIDSDQVTLIAGAVVALVPLAWSFWSHRAAAQVARAAALPEVARVVMTSRKAADAQPSPKVVAQ
jgi:hypothetical protein